jgi:hypothetical protein
MMVLGVLAASGYWGGSAYLDHRQREQAQAKLAQLAQQQQMQDTQRQLKLQEQHRQVGIDVLKAAVLGKPTVAKYIPAMFGAIEQLPMFVAGWTMNSIACTAEACAVNWARGSFSTVVTFVAEAEHRGWATVSASGDTAVTSHPITVEAREAAVGELEAPVPFGIALESRLQEAQDAGLRYEMGKLQMVEQMLPQEAQAGQTPAPGQPLGAQPQPLEWKVGTAVLKGNRLFELRSMPDYLDHPAVAINTVRADIKNKQWTLELKYATR